MDYFERKNALSVGIDQYDNIKNLTGCVNDAHSLRAMLARNADGTINFASPRLMTTSPGGGAVDRISLKAAVRELFDDDPSIALFYFAGHGYVEDVGGFLCTTESASGDDGFPLAELMTIAGKSRARNTVIVLDSCHSGAAANRTDIPAIAEIREGMTILAASSPTQYAMEVSGGGAGVFTTLLVDALGGAAANLLGHVTPGSVYAHIDQSLGSRAQRPVFKTNVKSFVSLRKANAPIPLASLLRLANIFPQPEYRFPLDPSFEPERNAEQKEDPNIPPPNPINVEIFGVLQEYAKVNLVRPVEAPHMWHAAMWKKSCELTVLGQHYRRLVEQQLI
jgi:hypothetical protein